MSQQKLLYQWDLALGMAIAVQQSALQKGFGKKKECPKFIETIGLTAKDTKNRMTVP